MDEKLHLSLYGRHLWEERGALVVRGDFTEALVSRDLYQRRFGIAPTKDAFAEPLDRALAAAGLAALSLAERESWGWTLSMPGSEAGLFVAVEPEGMICGRARRAEKRGAAAVVQRQRPGREPEQSLYDPPDADPVRAVEEYFRSSAQIPTRIAQPDRGPGALLQALPRGSIEDLAGLEDAELLERIDAELEAGRLRRLEEVVLFYECRCDEEMLRGSLEALSARERSDLWNEREQIEAECPRCGRIYRIGLTKKGGHDD